MAQAAVRSNRRPEAVTLVAVTKTVSFERVLPFLHAGVHDVGENRVQEALAKYQGPGGGKRIQAMTHFIGQLQTNKAKKAAQFFDMIQSVDRWEIAEALDRHAAAANRKLPCLVELKISADEKKSGVLPEAFDEFLARLRALAHLDVQGLMGVAPYDQRGDAARPHFQTLRRLFEKSKLSILSMGMSGDFEAAVEEGSTLVRIGSALFGSRPA